MPSFKEYLIESETDSYFQLQYKIKFSSKNEHLKNEIEDIFNKKLSSQFPSIKIKSVKFIDVLNIISCTIIIDNESSKEIDNIKIMFEDTFRENDLAFLENDSYAKIINLDKIDVLVKMDLIKISLATTLKDVHKKLDCVQIDLFNAGSIKNNALGLLKMKRLQHIISMTPTQPKDILWLKIIRKYMESNNRDLLGCQDELIDNGLSAYAKI